MEPLIPKFNATIMPPNPECEQQCELKVPEVVEAPANPAPVPTDPTSLADVLPVILASLGIAYALGFVTGTMFSAAPIE